MNTNKMRGQIALVEFHDAVIDSLVLDMQGRCLVHFKHLPIYHERDRDNFEIWSYEAALQLFDVRKICVEGIGGAADYVSDMLSVGGDGDPLNSGRMPVDQRLSVSKVELRFGSGRVAEIECGTMLLTLERATEHVEDWAGPL